jgi:hypothetical protein
MRVSRRLVWLLTVLLLPTASSLAEDPPQETTAERLKRTLVSEGDPDYRMRAALDLGMNYPDLLVAAVDEVISDKREGDAAVLAAASVKMKLRHLRLLLVWAVSELDGEAELFLDKIDADHPHETVRAIGALGFLGDDSAVDRLLEIIREPDEQPALQAARALARLGRKSDAKEMVDAALHVESAHVRLHLAWAVQDVLGSSDRAASAFARFARKPGAIGRRAKIMADLLKHDPIPVEKYKVKLAAVRQLFDHEGGAEPPEIRGLTSHTERLQAVFEEMKKRVPGYYHLLCTAVERIEVVREAELFNFRRQIISLNASRVERWDRNELFEYYLIQYATIMFLAQMGDPCEGHRGWEEGLMDGWRFALDDGRLGLPKDPNEFMRGVLEDPPW